MVNQISTSMLLGFIGYNIKTTIRFYVSGIVILLSYALIMMTIFRLDLFDSYILMAAPIFVSIGYIAYNVNQVRIGEESYHNLYYSDLIVLISLFITTTKVLTKLFS